MMHISSFFPILFGFFLSFCFGQKANLLDVNDKQWMEENLNVKIFRNGDKIPQAQSDQEWQEAGFNEQPAWCYYEIKEGVTRKEIGILYNRFAVNDPRGLAPEGWHIATIAEWEELEKATKEKALPMLDLVRLPGKESKGLNTSGSINWVLYGWRDVGFGGWGNSVTYWVQGMAGEAMIESNPTISFSLDDQGQPLLFDFSSTSWIMGHYVRCVKD